MRRSNIGHNSKIAHTCVGFDSIPAHAANVVDNFFETAGSEVEFKSVDTCSLRSRQIFMHFDGKSNPRSNTCTNKAIIVSDCGSRLLSLPNRTRCIIRWQINKSVCGWLALSRCRYMSDEDGDVMRRCVTWSFYHKLLITIRKASNWMELIRNKMWQQCADVVTVYLIEKNLLPTHVHHSERFQSITCDTWDENVIREALHSCSGCSAGWNIMAFVLINLIANLTGQTLIKRRETEGNMMQPKPLD